MFESNRSAANWPVFGSSLCVLLRHGERLLDRQHATVGDHNVLQRAIGLVRFGRADLPDDVHSLQHLSEHHVLAIQPAGLLQGDEELRAVGVRTGVRHAQPSGAVVAQLEVLVLEFVAVVDRFAAGSIALGDWNERNSIRIIGSFN